MPIRTTPNNCLGTLNCPGPVNATAPGLGRRFALGSGVPGGGIGRGLGALPTKEVERTVRGKLAVDAVEQVMKNVIDERMGVK